MSSPYIPANRRGLPVELFVHLKRRSRWAYRVALALFALLFSSAVLAAEPLQIAYYEIHGNNINELRKEMSERGPIGRDGIRQEAYTQWYVHWGYKYVPSGDSCSLTSVAVKLDVMMTLPKWIKSDEVSQDLVNDWDEHMTALRQHANRYYEIGEYAANEIEQKLIGMSGSSGCKALGEDANSAAKAIIAASQAKDREFEASLGTATAHTTCDAPKYPPASLRNGEQGTVNGLFLIGADGRVIDKKLVKSSGFAALDDAALDAIAKCNFRRAKTDVAPAESWQPITYVWKIQ